MAGATTATQAAARARLIAVESYAVFLDLTGDGDSARSRTELRFTCTQPGAASFADLDAVAVHEVRLNGRRLDPRLVTGGRLKLSGLAAENSLIVDATVAVAGGSGGGGDGLARYTDPADGARYVLANCFPTAAPRVFCCFDQPDLRAELTLIVTVPAGWTCIANGAADHHPTSGEAGVWRFSPVASIKPYEFTLCAGPYVTVPGPAELTAAEPQPAVRCRASLADSAGLDRIAGLVGRIVSYYEALLGVRCPYPKLDVVFAPELGPLAMQLPAVMLVSERLLQRAADPADSFVDVVLAHEVAHLWFGCLVEGRWWDDLWLAEAMATYLSYEAAAAVLGQPDAWAEFALTGETAAYQADSLPGRLPVSSPVQTAADALTRSPSISYAKGTAVLRQLAALIGPEPMRAGLREYLTRFAWSAVSLDDLIRCWSAASGRDLTQWAGQWLQESGVNTLRPEITIGPDGVLTSLAILQDPPAGAPGPLRTHQLTIGLYDVAGSRLSRTGGVDVTVNGEWTHVPALTGARRPAAIVLNDADLTFAAVRPDAASWRALILAAMDVSDPLAEAVCWTAAWDMVLTAEFEAAEFAALVARRVTAGGPAVGLEQLLDRAVTGADYYAAADQRPAARQHLAAATLTAAEQGAAAGMAAAAARRRQKVLVRGYASCADSPAQRDLLRRWLCGRSLPAGVEPDLALRVRILANLAAADLVTDADLASYAADDPVGGDIEVATIQARRPRLPAKKAAWAAALAPGQSPRLARAHAAGIWVPGQEKLLAPFRDRYFAEALPAVRQHDNRTAQRLARALYPAILADDATLAATDTALAHTESADPVYGILLEQRALLRRMLAARKLGCR